MYNRGICGAGSSGPPPAGESGGVFLPLFLLYCNCIVLLPAPAGTGRMAYIMADIFDAFRRIEEKRTAASAAPITHLVVGLGNPGREYARTRHNTGFLCMDEVCRHWNAVTDRAKFRALVGEAAIAGSRCLLMRPQTLMNASGLAVAEAARFYRIDPSRIIVISDDINLPVGGMRVRAHGSDGGQRGIRSIIAELGTDQFPRIRIGVGSKPHPDYDLAAWVLSDFTDAELSVLSELFPIACRGIECLVTGDADRAMQICNRKG